MSTTKKIRYNQIKAVLSKKGLSNDYLAEKMGINPSTISRWCTNAQQPRIPHLFEIATILNVEIGGLFLTMEEINEQLK